MRFVISSLSKFALNDVLTLCKTYQGLLYELDTPSSLIPDDSIYYRMKLKEFLPKTQDILNFREDTLLDFKEKNTIKDYLYDYLITFNFIRLENVVVKLPEEIDSISFNFQNFFEVFPTLPTFSAKEISDKDTEKLDTDFIIFKDPKVDVKDILILQQLLQQQR